jgi:DNA-binding response OmpR family regulator
VTKILVAEDSPTQAAQIRILLEQAGHQVALAGNGKEALAALQSQQPELVLTDLDMPEMNGLRLVEAVRSKYPRLPVILMTAFGSEEVAIQALDAGAASYVPKRNLARDLLETVRDVLSVAQANRQQQRLTEFLTQSNSRFTLDTDTGPIMSIVNHLQGVLTDLQLLDETESIRVGVALETALHQAVCQGNLELREGQLQESYDLSDAGASYFQKLAERRRQQPYSERRVHCDAKISRDEAVFEIRHEGPGFDRAILDEPAKDADRLERDGERGWLLIKHFLDQVTLDESGQTLRLVKRRSRNGSPGATS